MIAEKTIKRAFASFIALWAAEATLLETRAQPMLPLTNTVFMAEVNLASEKGSIWENGVGEGFRSTTQSFGLRAGVTYGFSSFGSVEAHDLALITLSHGHMLGHVWGEGHWYRGNLEFRVELFTGAQFSPSREWFVGLTPHLRYNFATGTRWIPFVDDIANWLHAESEVLAHHQQNPRQTL